MFVELSPAMKSGILIHLSNYPRLNQFLPEDRIFGLQVPSNPEYPYLRFGTPIPTPYVSSCWTGTAMRTTLDVFAQGSPGTEAGETQVGRLAQLVVEAINSLRFEELDILDNTYLGSRFSMVSDEADRWRATLEFNITAVSSAI